MKLIRTLFYIFILATFNLALAANVKPYALIYNGVTTCEGCPETIADVVKKTHLPVKFVKDPEAIPDLLKHAAIFIIGGTDDDIEPMRKAFNNHIVTAIKNYLNAGGNYLGICGGAFIAAKEYGFGIIPATAEDYSENSKAKLLTINWKGKDVVLYFQGGPAFLLDKTARDIQIIATYSNGEIAAFSYPYGKGKVIVVGPHPEADKTWLEEDHINSKNWQPKQALIIELINHMISK